MALTKAERDAGRLYREGRARERKQAKAQRPAKVLPTAKGQRHPRVKDPAYLAFIRRQPCCICGKPAPSQAAHVRSGYPEAGWRPTGMAEKPDDRRTLPLCAADHLDGPTAQHKSNEAAWWKARGIHPPTLAAAFVQIFEETP